MSGRWCWRLRSVVRGGPRCRAYVRRWWPAVVCAVGLVCSVTGGAEAQTAVAADDPQFARLRLREPSEADVLHRYFEDLRRRGLFGLAEREAMRRLAEPRLAEGLVLELTVELTETFAAHAIERPPEEAAELWARAERQIDALSRQFAADPRFLLIELQRARLHYLHALADLLTHELRVLPEEWNAEAAPVQRLIAVVGELEKLSKSAGKQPPAATQDGDPSAVSPQQIRESLALWIGSAYCELCLHATRGRYPAISPLFRDIAKTAASGRGFAPEQIDAWANAGLKWLRELEARGTVVSAAEREAAWRRAQILRVVGKRDEAWALLQSLPTDPGDALAERIAAERARTAIARGAVLDAADELLAVRRRLGNVGPELHYLNGVVLFELASVARRAGKDAAAEEATVQARAHLQRAVRGGGFWGQWAQRELRRREAETLMGPELAALIERAEWQQRQQRYDQALETYAAAAVTAYRQGRLDAAFDAAYRRASLLYALKRWNDAYVAFSELAERFPEQSRAPAAALLAADCLIRRQQQGAAVGDEEIERSLGEVVRRLRDRNEAYEARRLLARWYESHGRPLSALVQYEQMLAASESAAGSAADGSNSDNAMSTGAPWQVVAAIAGVARCYERVSASAAEVAESATPTSWSPGDAAGRAVDDARVIASRSRSQWVSQAIDRLETLVSRFRPLMEQRNDAEAALPWIETLLRLARLYLTRDPAAHARADELLQQALQWAERTKPHVGNDRERETLQQLVRAAQQLRVISLAGQGRVEDAGELLRAIAASDTEHLLSVLDGLMAAARSGAPEMRRRLADLQLMAATLLVGEQAESVGTAAIPRQRRPLTREQRVRVYAAIAEAFIATDQPGRAIAAARTALQSAPQDAALRRRFGELFVECGTRECLQEALALWRWIEAAAADGSRDFLEARYHIMRCLAGLGRADEARKLARVTRLLYESDQHADLWRKIRMFESGERTR